MSEMIERMAVAMMKVEWDDKLKDYYKFARAAIEALRDPTDAMVLAGEEHIHDNTDVVDLWRDMLEAALK